MVTQDLRDQVLVVTESRSAEGIEARALVPLGVGLAG
jgi:hypothetical protein